MVLSKSNKSWNLKYHLKMSSDGFKMGQINERESIWPEYTFNKPCHAIHILCSLQCWWDLEIQYVDTGAALLSVLLLPGKEWEMEQAKQFIEKTT